MELSVFYICIFLILKNLFLYLIENNKCYCFDERLKLLVWVIFGFLMLFEIL